MINITLPDGSQRQVDSGTTALDVAMSISEGLARNVLAAEVNGEVWDPQRPIGTDATLKLLTWKDDAGKSTMWHSSAHLLAEALEALFPRCQILGGATDRKWLLLRCRFRRSNHHGQRLWRDRIEDDGIGKAKEPVCSIRNEQSRCNRLFY